jgi:hypothetical protein
LEGNLPALNDLGQERRWAHQRIRKISKDDDGALQMHFAVVHSLDSRETQFGSTSEETPTRGNSDFGSSVAIVKSERV